MMKTRPQMTSVEETIRIPDWRSASPKNLNTRSREDLADDLAGELEDLAEGLDPGRGMATVRSSFTSTIEVISGWVASRVCVNA